VAEPIVESLKHKHRFYRLETITHRYPHCWRCGTPLVFRLVDEWYISMGPVYDVSREQLTPAQVDASLRYQIMDVIRDIKWIPGFGYERELDWLLNMHDWMISKKRYWGLALPIYDCECGTVNVVGGREELAERAVEGWDQFEGHTPHRPYVDAVKIRCSGCGEPVSRITTSAIPGWTPASCRSRRCTTAPTPDYWKQWFPADFVTESFPGQFRNWFYSLLAMSTVLRREAPFKTLFGYALVFGEDGRPMHKSWGNAIEFDEAAERMGVDVMRWMFANARPEDNILFGWHAADEARRRLLVLWNVYSFFVTYARLAEWDPGRRAPAVAERGAAGPLDPVARRGAGGRGRGRPARVRRPRRRREIDGFIEELSTWYLRRSRANRQGAEPRDRAAAFATMHATCGADSDHGADPAVPERVDLPEPGRRRRRGRRSRQRPPDAWPTEELEASQRSSAPGVDGRRHAAVDLARTLRARPASRCASRWRGCGWRCRAGRWSSGRAARARSDEVNVKSIELIGDESELVDRRVKPLLPKIGKKLGRRSRP
jgi:isoleucyl-tRNA synthetase